MSTDREKHGAAPPAIDRIYRSEKHWMLKYAMRVLRDAGAAEDAVHNVFARLVQAGTRKSSALDQLRQALPVRRAYLMAAIKNECLHEVRRRQNRDRVTDALARDPTFLLAESYRSIPELAAHAEAVLRTLPPRCADVVRLWAQSLPHAEIAQRLGIQASTVNAQLQRAKWYFRRERERDRQTDRQRDRESEKVRRVKRV